MSQPKEFFSFEEALEELRLKEEELKRLVSEGEIRAFREGETMKLRRRDVEALRAELLGDEVVEFGAATEELVFEDDADLVDPGMATEELSSAATLIDEELDVEELEIEELADDDLGDDEFDTAADRRAAAARTNTRVRAQEEPTRDAGMLALLIATSLVFVLALPVSYALRSGVVSDFAGAVAGIFTNFGEQG